MNVMHERRFIGRIESLRSPERVALLEVERVVLLSLEALAAGSVLDVGTGTGIFAEAFSRRDLDVVGVDSSARMIAIARRYVPEGRFLVSEAERLPFAGGSFDLVFLGHVLHEADDPLGALTEAGRIARVRVVVLEWPHRADEHGPPLEHRLKPEAILAMAERAHLPRRERIALAHMDLYRLEGGYP
jgi:ubiquinone/menaquinone biosynthesis C-methylase UbiE